MRILGIILIALGTVNAIAAEPSEQSYPPWNGHETIADYAKRTNLPPARKLNLDNETTLELVLIPAGTFIMGTPEPPPVNEEGFRTKILTGQVILMLGGGFFAFFLGGVVVPAIRKRQRPQYSLARLLAITVAAGVGMLGAFQWRHARQAFEAAKFARVLNRHGSDMEKPAHEVTLTKPFYIGKYEITQQQYQIFMGMNPRSFKVPRSRLVGHFSLEMSEPKGDDVLSCLMVSYCWWIGQEAG